ncbi:hypothetical protein JCM19992_17560 [Thermostilla marina]
MSGWHHKIGDKQRADDSKDEGNGHDQSVETRVRFGKRKRQKYEPRPDKNDVGLDRDGDGYQQAS